MADELETWLGHATGRGTRPTPLLLRTAGRMERAAPRPLRERFPLQVVIGLGGGRGYEGGEFAGRAETTCPVARHGNDDYPRKCAGIHHARRGPCARARWSPLGAAGLRVCGRDGGTRRVDLPTARIRRRWPSTSGARVRARPGGFHARYSWFRAADPEEERMSAYPPAGPGRHASLARPRRARYRECGRGLKSDRRPSRADEGQGATRRDLRVASYKSRRARRRDRRVKTSASPRMKKASRCPSIPSQPLRRFEGSSRASRPVARRRGVDGAEVEPDKCGARSTGAGNKPPADRRRARGPAWQNRRRDPRRAYTAARSRSARSRPARAREIRRRRERCGGSERPRRA